MKISRRPITIPVEERRAPASGIIAFGSFNLDDLGAQIGQCLASPRTRENTRQFDDFQPGKQCHALIGQLFVKYPGEILI